MAINSHILPGDIVVTSCHTVLRRRPKHEEEPAPGILKETLQIAEWLPAPADTLCLVVSVIRPYLHSNRGSFFVVTMTPVPKVGWVDFLVVDPVVCQREP